MLAVCLHVTVSPEARVLASALRRSGRENLTGTAGLAPGSVCGPDK